MYVFDIIKFRTKLPLLFVWSATLPLTINRQERWMFIRLSCDGIALSCWSCLQCGKWRYEFLLENKALDLCLVAEYLPNESGLWFIMKCKKCKNGTGQLEWLFQGCNKRRHKCLYTTFIVQLTVIVQLQWK